ncbi:MAG: DUF4176 domain-containing protein [Bacteroidales bacterium]|nr:DUF4176 domain-containing protein [Clostridium sp.]MCM1203542.1 DUF4176 domain-containing protein [Bacteroidales bacterium]
MDQKIYLPIGTVVLLKNGIKKVMIYGRKQKNVKTNEEFDYLACLYPEGNIRSDLSVMFNHEDIKTIIYEGYSDEEEKIFCEKYLNKGKKE